MSGQQRRQRGASQRSPPPLQQQQQQQQQEALRAAADRVRELTAHLTAHRQALREARAEAQQLREELDAQRERQELSDLQHQRDPPRQGQLPEQRQPPSHGAHAADAAVVPPSLALLLPGGGVTPTASASLDRRRDPVVLSTAMGAVNFDGAASAEVDGDDVPLVQMRPSQERYSVGDGGAQDWERMYREVVIKRAGEESHSRQLQAQLTAFERQVTQLRTRLSALQEEQRVGALKARNTDGARGEDCPKCIVTRERMRRKDRELSKLTEEVEALRRQNRRRIAGEERERRKPAFPNRRRTVGTTGAPTSLLPVPQQDAAARSTTALVVVARDDAEDASKADVGNSLAATTSENAIHGSALPLELVVDSSAAAAAVSEQKSSMSSLLGPDSTLEELLASGSEYFPTALPTPPAGSGRRREEKEQSVATVGTSSGSSGVADADKVNAPLVVVEIDDLRADPSSSGAGEKVGIKIEPDDRTVVLDSSDSTSFSVMHDDLLSAFGSSPPHSPKAEASIESPGDEVSLAASSGEKQAGDELPSKKITHRARVVRFSSMVEDDEHGTAPLRGSETATIAETTAMSRKKRSSAELGATKGPEKAAGDRSERARKRTRPTPPADPIASHRSWNLVLPPWRPSTVSSPRMVFERLLTQLGRVDWATGDLQAAYVFANTALALPGSRKEFCAAFMLTLDTLARGISLPRDFLEGDATTPVLARAMSRHKQTVAQLGARVCDFVWRLSAGSVDHPRVVDDVMESLSDPDAVVADPARRMLRGYSFGRLARCLYVSAEGDETRRSTITDRCTRFLVCQLSIWRQRGRTLGNRGYHRGDAGLLMFTHAWPLRFPHMALPSTPDAAQTQTDAVSLLLAVVLRVSSLAFDGAAAETASAAQAEFGTALARIVGAAVDSLTETGTPALTSAELALVAAVRALGVDLVVPLLIERWRAGGEQNKLASAVLLGAVVQVDGAANAKRCLSSIPATRVALLELVSQDDEDEGVPPGTGAAAEAALLSAVGLCDTAMEPVTGKSGDPLNQGSGLEASRRLLLASYETGPVLDQVRRMQEKSVCCTW